MKIVVLMKQVANKDAVLRIGKDAKWIDETDTAYETNESDGYALEESLRLKEAKGGGEVIVCSLGPNRVKTVIKDALARGADRAIHIVVEDVNTMSPFQIAKTLAEAVKDEQPDLVMSGLQSDDNGYGQTGVILAELLGIPHATLVIEIDRETVNGKIRLKRELESGWYQWFTYQTPALLTIQSGISQIRYASLKGIMAAKKKEIKEVTPSSDATSFDSRQEIEKIYFPLKMKQTQMLGAGDAKRGAAELIEKLRAEVRIF
ncbi:MAG: electron transfer flavoprotein subunit beta/FixA family protein [Pyrinomonadaceae bacterium]